MAGVEAAEPTGAARRARERRNRCLARRVGWLTGLFQAGASHHTHSTQPGDRQLAVCSGCAALEATVTVLHHRMADLQIQVTELARRLDDDTGTEMKTATKQELVSSSDHGLVDVDKAVRPKTDVKAEDEGSEGAGLLVDTATAEERAISQQQKQFGEQIIHSAADEQNSPPRRGIQAPISRSIRPLVRVFSLWLPQAMPSAMLATSIWPSLSMM